MVSVTVCMCGSVCPYSEREMARAKKDIQWMAAALHRVKRSKSHSYQMLMGQLRFIITVCFYSRDKSMLNTAKDFPMIYCN